MYVLRQTTLLAALFFLAACALEIDEATTADEPLRFSDIQLAEDAPAAALAGAQADAGLIGDVAAEAGITSGNLFGGLFASAPAAPVDSGISFGTQVPYGKIAKVCDAPRGGLGTLISDISGFRIYDSNPGSTQLRAHYVTGFKDGCTRQFSSALTLTGDVGTHEVVRYLPTNSAAYNATDKAYEAIKASFCRAGFNKPCGTRLNALAKNTTFITAYETFGSRPRWAEILLHNGEMKAMDFKTD